jgi:hypothetical protein
MESGEVNHFQITEESIFSREIKNILSEIKKMVFEKVLKAYPIMDDKYILACHHLDYDRCMKEIFNIKISDDCDGYAFKATKTKCFLLVKADSTSVAKITELSNDV